MKTTQRGIELIKSFEGLYLEPYLCPAGVWTIGYGTTVYPKGNRVKASDKHIREIDAEAYLKHDLSYFEKQVDSLTRDDITENQFSALVSFAYNVGVGNLKSSTLLKKVNANPNDKSIAKEFSKWVYANNRKLNGLIKRRAKEAELYIS